MKKDRKPVFGGIRNKLFLLILLTVILITASFFAVTTYQNNMLSQLSGETSRKQQQSIAEITESVMAEEINSNLRRITRLEAMATDDIFTDAKSRVELVSQIATRLFANPGNFSLRPYSRPDPSKEGELSACVIFAEDTNPSDPDVLSATGLAANMSDLMLYICRIFDTDNVYVALPEGVFLSVSRNASTWYLEDGSLMDYDPRTRFWYKQAVEAGELVFTDMETDANTGELSLVCAKPVYGPNGKLRAVVGTDLFLTSMQESMQAAEQEGGSLLVVNREGHVVASSLNESEFTAKTSDNASDLRESENEELAAFIRDTLDGETAVRLVHLDSGAYYMTGEPISVVGWAMISILSEETANRSASMLQDSFSEIEGEAVQIYRSRNRKAWIVIISAIVALLVIFGAAALLQGGKIVKPLNAMTARISAMGEEELEFTMEDTYRTGDEIEILADSFARLSRKTIDYVEQVRSVTAEKERIGAELNMAAAIQSSMLPHNFPPYPDRTEFDLYASMDPAKEVGGDFYDFFLIDDDHLGIVMADVSGKGVPAALFMMVSKVILQSVAMLGGSPESILTKTNEAICSNNQVDMFVTVWVGILEISTGKLTAANAGHEYPVLMRAGGNFELFKDKHGFVIGGMEGVKYRQYELQLNPGDKLFLYTDGVPEATDADKNLFGTERMIGALNKSKDSTPKEVLRGVREAVDSFVKEAEQFDDLTMLCLDYRGPQHSA